MNIKAGVDEVGRGCLAGPVVSAVVILKKTINTKNIQDSKKLNFSERIELSKYIKKNSWFAIGFASVSEINHINILSEWYELPYPPNRNYESGLGSLFYSQKQYNPTVILIAFFISSGTVVAVGIVSHNQIKKRMHSSDPESFL